MLRLFLAISVVISHITPLFGLHLMPGDVAVKLFFIISGFYMSMVMAAKYDGRNRTLFFYSNRALRLYPAYLIALILTAVVLVIAEFQPGAPQRNALIGEFFGRSYQGHEIGLDALAALTLPNLVIFGSELVYMFSHSVKSGWFFTLLAPQPGVVRGGAYLLIGPVWSISVELCFYLMVPFISRARTATIVVLLTLSLAIQFALESWHPWTSYFFFPALLCFFLLGMLAHRFWASGIFQRIPARMVWVVALFAMFLLVAREFIPGYRNYPVLVYGVMVVVLPFIFDAFKAIPWDRWVGNLSYPVYLTHTAVIFGVQNYTHQLSPPLIVAITLVLAAAINFLVEEPLERYRQRRAAHHFSVCYASSAGHGLQRVEPEIFR